MLKRLLFIIALAITPASVSAGTILVFGDSLSAGYGLAQKRGWVDLLDQRLREQGLNYRVANASISGETTVGGANRIAGALKTHNPSIVVLELGANDGLRGHNVEVIKRNLAAMIGASQRAKAKVLLVGMRLPPNYGTGYTEKFQQIYVDLARANKTALVPFLMEGFADDGRFFQNDRVHPTTEAQSLILETVWKELKPMLRR